MDDVVVTTTAVTIESTAMTVATTDVITSSEVVAC